MSEKVEGLIHKVEGANRVFLTQMTVLLISAFGFCTALAWNDAVNVTIKSQFGGVMQTYGLFAYAIIVTGISCVVTFVLSRFTPQHEEQS